MAEARSVSVVLKADIQDYVSKMGQASKATKDFAAQTGKVSGSASTSTKNLGTSAKSASTDLDKAAKSAKGFGDSATKASDGAAKAAKSTQDTAGAARNVGAEMALAGAAIAAGIGLAVKAFADFDKEMSNVRAVSGATAGQMLQLKDAALEAGAATKFSASDAAKAEAELVKAGISVKDVLGGALLGSLDLAAAGNLDLANAATISAQAMNIFSLEGKDVGHIADVLAAGANKSAADVGQLGDALRQGGLVAAQTGLSLEETTGILSAFADNALIGSDAGTSLKTMLQRLVPSSAAAASAMNDIGFSAYDAQGNLKSAADIAENLKTGLAGLTAQQKDQTLATIFGSDAVRGANVLYKLGAAGVKDYTKAVNDNGAAARVAAIQMDNLAGDFENLRGSFETALIQSGSGANDALRGLAQSANSAVKAFSELPDSVQSSVLGLAALASGALLVGGGLATVIPKIVATKAALDALSVSAPRAAGALGVLSKAVAVVAVADAATQIRGMAAASQVGAPAVSDLADSLLKVAENGKDAGKFGDLFARGAGPFRQTFEDASAALDDFGANANAATNSTWYETLFGTGAEAESIFATRVQQIDKALVELVQSGHGDEAAKLVERLANSTTQFGGDANKVRDAFTGYKAAVESSAVANGQYADSVDGVKSAQTGAAAPGKLLADQIKDQKQAAEDAQKAYDDLTKSVKGYGDQVASALSASAGYEAAIDNAATVATSLAAAQAAVAKFDADAAAERARLQGELGKAKTPEDKARIQDQLKDVGDPAARQRLVDQTKEYAKTLDITTEAGRRNQGMLLDIAEAAKASAVENFKNGDSVDSVQKRMSGARDTFIQQAQAFGANKTEAQQLADKLGLTAANVDTLRQASATPIDIKANVDLGPITTFAGAVAALKEQSKSPITITAVTKFLTTERLDEAAARRDAGGYATGGKVAGPGTGTSDSIPAYLSNGEYVIKAAAVDRYGSHFFDRLNTMRFADGGLVSSAMSSVSNSSSLSNDNRINIENVHGADVTAIQREADRRRRLAALKGRRA